MFNCNAAPDFGGSNFTNAPAFADFAARDFHLAAGSACIDAGANVLVAGSAVYGAEDIPARIRLLRG